MVDKSAGTAGAGAVHALFYAAFKIGYFGVFAAKLDSHVGLRNKLFYSHRSCGNLLNKGYVKPFGHVYSAASRNRHGSAAFADFVYTFGQYFRQGFFDVRIVSLIFFMYNFAVFVKDNYLNRCRTNVKSDMEHTFISFLLKHAGFPPDKIYYTPIFLKLQWEIGYKIGRNRLF